jgi:hypothetical protein
MYIRPSRVINLELTLSLCIFLEVKFAGTKANEYLK